jgi:ankyrin repeat protein
VDPTALNKHGWSALHLASRWGHVEVVQFLLDHDTDATIQDNYGSTPLRLALQGGHIGVARLLVDYRTNTTGMDGQVVTLSPWQVALHQGDVDLARVLERDADATA